MSLAYHVDSKEQFCRTCGVLVQHDLLQTIPPGTYSWHPVNHAAPCGKVCLSGGCPAQLYRAGLVRQDACSVCDRDDPAMNAATRSAVAAFIREWERQGGRFMARISQLGGGGR